MSVFFTDLDNTMIYSHHREIGKPKIVIEHLDGKEQSFMTEFTYDFLSSAEWLDIVPVTTRTKQQYEKQMSIKDVMSKICIAVIFGYYTVKTVENFSYIDVLWNSLHVGLFILMGTIKMIRSYIFITDEYRGRIVKKTNNLDMFYNYIQNKQTEESSLFCTEV